MMPIKPTTKPKRRTKHSYRPAIHEVIRQRIARGAPLHIREIIEEAGGGSISTVRDELAKLVGQDQARASALVGAGARSAHERVPALERAIDDALEREKLLLAENQVLKATLEQRNADVEKLLLTHTDSQRMLLQGVDDLRQMVRAGRESLPAGVLAAEQAKVAGKDGDSKAVYWQTKHDQLLARYVDMEKKNRALMARLHDLGVDL